MTVSHWNERGKNQNRKLAYHQTKLPLRMLPPVMGRVRVRERGFETSSDAVWVAAPPQRVPEPGPPSGGGGSASAAR